MDLAQPTFRSREAFALYSFSRSFSMPATARFNLLVGSIYRFTVQDLLFDQRLALGKKTKNGRCDFQNLDLQLWGSLYIDSPNSSGLLSQYDISWGSNQQQIWIHRFGNRMPVPTFVRKCLHELDQLFFSLKLHTESMLHTLWTLLCQIVGLKDLLEWNYVLGLITQGIIVSLPSPTA